MRHNIQRPQRVSLIVTYTDKDGNEHKVPVTSVRGDDGITYTYEYDREEHGKELDRLIDSRQISPEQIEVTDRKWA